MSTDPIVISGLGVVSPIGISVPAFARSLKEGRSGWGPIGSFSVNGCKVKHAYEVDPAALSSKATILDAFIQYALHATDQALKDAKLDPEQADRARMGITVSSSKGGLKTFEVAHRELRKRGGAKSAIQSAKAYANLAPNMASQWIARTYKIKGPAECPVAACATGIHSIIVAYHMILDGRADVVIAGASDASITPFVLSAYNRMGVYAKGRLKPYDKSRDGFVVGEGAGVMILEKLSSAQKRNAPIYAKITGVNLSADAFHPIHFNAKADTLAHSIRAACQQAGWDPQKLDYVNTHGTGTQEGDLYELAQLEKVFGTHNNGVAMSSIKAMTGHMLGASGVVELVACCLAMKHGFVPPTIYLDMPDPACHLDMTAHTAREKKINRALSFSMGFGGHVGTVALEKI